MSSDQQQIPDKVLVDLCSRFIINIPAEQRDDLVRVLFAVELAHWFYIDFYCEDDNELHVCNIKEFAQQIFQHCPFLRDYVQNIDSFLSQWREYKLSVPTYGAALIDPTFEHVLLVRGFYNRESWGFPKGKVQENESPLKCAIREVKEEVGFDMKDRAIESQYLERDLNGQLIRLYIVKDVPLDTKFAAKTKNEIKEMRWFRIDDLPSHRRDAASQMKLCINPKAFFMVIPFIKDLRRWIKEQRGTYSSSNGDSDNANEYMKLHDTVRMHQQPYYPQSRRRAATYSNHSYNSRPIEIQQKLSGVDQPTSSITRDGTFFHEHRKNPSKIIANLTPQTSDDQPQTPTRTLQKQRSVQDTIQRHFSQILKNDSITVTDNTSITETILMRENHDNSTILTPLTPPMSNDDENKHPVSGKNHKGKKSSHVSTGVQQQYRILRRDQLDDSIISRKPLESNNCDINTSDKFPRNRRRTDRYVNHDITQSQQVPLSNLTNDTFRFNGPRCWTKFRLNRSEVVRCLHE